MHHDWCPALMVLLDARLYNTVGVIRKRPDGTSVEDFGFSRHRDKKTTTTTQPSLNAMSSAGLSIRKMRQFVFEVRRGIYLFTFQHERQHAGS